MNKIIKNQETQSIVLKNIKNNKEIEISALEQVENMGLHSPLAIFLTKRFLKNKVYEARMLPVHLERLSPCCGSGIQEETGCCIQCGENIGDED